MASSQYQWQPINFLLGVGGGGSHNCVVNFLSKDSTVPGAIIRLVTDAPRL
jgi:hypothetical protein